MSSSRYDKLHDKYDPILTTKAGTRYERLAAMVFKILEQQNVVIHDVSMIGDTDVAHQIDVSITENGNLRRVLIECKDFDVSEEKVGLGIVRNFWAVLDDTKADEGYIITCNGFTSEAAKYAKGKGIKLAVLRAHEEKDWDGYIKTVVLRLMMLAPANPTMNISVPDAAQKALFDRAMSALPSRNGVSIHDPVYMVKGSEKIHFNRFMTDHMNKAIPFQNTPDRGSVHVESDGWKIEIAGASPIGFDHVDISFDIEKDLRESSITSQRIAELILSGIGDKDLIIFGDQIEKLTIDPDTGEVQNDD